MGAVAFSMPIYSYANTHKLTIQRNITIVITSILSNLFSPSVDVRQFCVTITALTVRSLYVCVCSLISLCAVYLIFVLVNSILSFNFM